MNIYEEILAQNIPKLLSLYNADTYSATYGYGDREYWGWKIKDFSNGTMQGGVHTLAIALKLKLFTVEEKEKVLDMIYSAISAVENICDPNGSLSEAYPQENSFCVTALVAFDILSAIDYLGDDLDIEIKKKYLSIIRPLIQFITDNDEEHAIISNHLATGVAAITLWNHLSKEYNPRGDALLKIIYQHQSPEGWYKEYEGADPGYQTLCTYYLACAYRVTKNQKLLDSLRKSAVFLSHFIHPDGTVGGLYGSRNTEVFYPAGIVMLADMIDECAMIAKYLSPQGQHILPQDIDIGNYIPLLNAYAVSAFYFNDEPLKKSAALPFCTHHGEKKFPHAGLYIHSNKTYFAIVNYKKGGTLKVFNQSTCEIDLEDGGLFGHLNNKKKFSTQRFDETVSFQNKTLKSHFYQINDTYPSPFSFVILRILALTLFRSVRLGNIFKKFIVSLLMTGKQKLDGWVDREFVFLDEKIVVRESIQKPKKCIGIGHYGKSKAIHMASSGYYLSQNRFNASSTLVEFQNA